MGLDAKFIQWVELCITSPWITPLVNGRVIDFFKAFRGLRQGFPLSPFLYVIVADSLGRRLEFERSSSHLLGIKFSTGTRSINHGQFVDDTIWLVGASVLIGKRF